MSPWLFNVYMDVVMEIARMGVKRLEDNREWKLLGFLYADDLVLCGESEEDLKVMVGRFVEVYKRRALKVNAEKSKVMVLGGEEEVECEIHVDAAQLEQV